MRVREVVVCSVLAAGLSCLPSAPAGAATIVVTERKDVVADDGRCSLREAVDAANTGTASGATPGECVAGDAPPTVDVIRLRRVKYVLSLGAPGDDANREGDLDITESVVIAGKGAGKTKVVARFGDSAIPGDGDRLFHVDPAAAGGVEVTFSGLTIGKGDVGCDGAGCTTGASAVEANGTGQLLFDGCDVTDNAATCSGAGCGDARHGAAIRATAGGRVKIVGSRIRGNRTRCVDPQCVAGVAAVAAYDVDGTPMEVLILEDSVIRGNSASCLAEGCTSAGIVAVDALAIGLEETAVEGNAVDCQGPSCTAGAQLDVRAGYVVLEDLSLANATTACAGDACATRSALEVATPGVATLVASRLAGVATSCQGAGCSVGGVAQVNALAPDLEAFEVSGSTLSCVGQRCSTGSLVDVESGGLSRWQEVRILDNQATCSGADCNAEDFVELSSDEAIVIAESTIAANVSACDGDGCEARRILDAEAPEAVQVQASSITGNAVRCAGTKCKLEAVVDLASDQTIAIDASAFEANLSSCEGNQCKAEVVLAVDAELASIKGGRIATNGSQCDGTSCTVGFGGALRNEARTLNVTSTTLDDNRTDGVGAAVYNAPGSALVLARVKMRGNEAGLRSAIPFGGLGGAICNGATSGTYGSVRVLRSQITGNRASVAGGGIANGGILVVKGGSLEGNSPEDCFDGGNGVGCP